MKQNKYFGPVCRDEAIFLLRQKQQLQAHREMMMAAVILTQLLQMNERAYSDLVRKQRTRRMTDVLLGGPAGFGLLQERLDRHTGGLFTLLREDLPQLRHIDLLVFSYAAAGMAHDLMAALCLVDDPRYINGVLHRMRMEIGRLETPRKYEYLALLGPKGCHFGEEMLYLPDM